MAKRPTDADEEPIPHQWGESYRAMKQPINPPGRPKAPAPIAKPVRPPVLGRGTRSAIEDADKRAAREGTESLLQKDKRMGRK